MIMLSIKSKILVKSFYNTFLGLLIKKGNLVSAKTLLDHAFTTVLKTIEIPFNLIIFKIILLLNTFVEVKQVKKYKKFNYHVPFPITLKRKLYLSVKWIVDSALEDKRKLPFFEKISHEIVLLLTNKSISKSYKKKHKNLDLAMANKSNVHFRW
jgi:ribosomal protein S7